MQRKVTPGSTVDVEKQKTKLIKNLEEIKKRDFLGLFEPDRKEELLKIGENWNATYLSENYKVTKEDIDALYKLAKFYFEIGQYERASELLKYFLAINSDPQKEVSALWGKLSADIVISNWIDASKTLLQLRDSIENPVNQPHPLKQLQQRVWFIHWSLFIYFAKGVSGFTTMLDQFINNERYLNAIQSAAPWVFRYLIVASIITKTKQKEIIKIIEQESYTDPLIEFMKALYGKYNFDSAEKQLEACIPVLTNDYFISGSAEVQNLKNEFILAAKFAIGESFCMIHRTIDIGKMATKLGITNEESECWIVNFIRSSKLEAKIDIANNLVLVQPRIPSVYQQCLERTKILMLRTGVIATQEIATK